MLTFSKLTPCELSANYVPWITDITHLTTTLHDHHLHATPRSHAHQIRCRSNQQLHQSIDRSFDWWLRSEGPNQRANPIETSRIPSRSSSATHLPLCCFCSHQKPSHSHRKHHATSQLRSARPIDTIEIKLCRADSLNNTHRNFANLIAITLRHSSAALMLPQPPKTSCIHQNYHATSHNFARSEIDI